LAQEVNDASVVVPVHLSVAAVYDSDCTSEMACVQTVDLAPLMSEVIAAVPFLQCFCTEKAPMTNCPEPVSALLLA